MRHKPADKPADEAVVEREPAPVAAEPAPSPELEPEPVPENADPEPWVGPDRRRESQPTVSIDKDWVRREIELALEGNSEDTRRRLNP